MKKAKRLSTEWSAMPSRKPSKVEERNFEIRKQLLEYDDGANGSAR